MTNIEKVKRILDAGHWVKVTYDDGVTRIITSYYGCLFSYVRTDAEIMVVLNKPDFKDCTIEVIQRIPTPYKSGDKVLVLSHPELDMQEIQSMVGTICTIRSVSTTNYSLWNKNKDDYFYSPAYCLAPVFDDQVSDTQILSGKEAKIVVDGKEYICVIK